MKKLYSTFLLVALFAVMIPAAPVQAQSTLETVTLQPAAAGMKDTQIMSDNQNTNYGNLTYVTVGEITGQTAQSRGLLEFDLSGLPYDMMVVSATLTLTVKEDLSDNARTMYAYAIRNNWLESEATWIRLMNWEVNHTPVWVVPGAGGAGTDVSVDPIGFVPLENNLAAGSLVTIALLPEAVSSMSKLDYFGFKLQMETESDDAYSFYSADDAVETNRPKLVIEYYPNAQFIVDPGWTCYEGPAYWSQYFPECLPDPPGTTVPMSPYTRSGGRDSISWNYGYGNTVTTPVNAATIDCDPRPRCVNNYPIHYRVEMEGVWNGAPGNDVALTAQLNIPGGVTILKSIECGTGTSGHCEAVWEGEFLTTDLPVNTDTYTVGLGFRFNGLAVAWSGNAVGWNIYLSLEEFDQQCTDTYFTPAPETFTIDPTIETPLGVNGVPADHQIYPTVIGQTYMLHVKDGPWWSDAATQRTDAAVSVDGTTWVTLSDFTFGADCVSSNPVYPGDDYRYIFFTATTETLYIRANDTPGAFADNANDAETPFGYVAGAAYLIADVGCETQFTYDPVADLMASVAIDSNLEDTLAATPLQVGEWYAVEVASGTWSEPPYNVPLISMQYLMEGNLAGGLLWDDLAVGSSMVECVTDGVAYLQASDLELHLRADDQDAYFDNNIGVLQVNIYHASFQRTPDTCELSFALNDLVRSDSVDAKQALGKVFAMAVGSALTNNNEQTENYLSGALVPGAWYALETTGGPWGYPGDGRYVASNYDLAISKEPAGTNFTVNDDTKWGTLATWDEAACNVQTDKLGHRLVYFQIPVTVASQWKLRVNDNTASSSSWITNTGVMSWNLYRAIDLGPTDSGLCDYSYDPATDKVTLVPGMVQADSANGDLIERSDLVGTLPLLTNTYYAVEILGADYQWYEQTNGAQHTDMELSLNNGQTWADVPGGGELCSVVDGANLIFFLHTGNSAPEFKLRVNSTTFDDNVGAMGYNVYTAAAGTSIDPYDGCVSDGYSVSTIGPIEWIPVKDPAGRGITSTSASYAEITGLVPGNRYVVETSRGPWTDGETMFENSTNLAPKYSAQVSADDGVTWQEMDGTNTNITCWETSPDFKYRKIEFLVTAGQIWKIRVADVNSATFEDNEGQLAYTLKGEVLPADEVVTGTVNLVGCNTPAMAPGIMSISELPNLGNFLAEWLDYLGASILNFFAWCPDNTAAVTMFTSDLQTREPFATVDETYAILNDVKNEINGYEWGSTSTDFSILTKPPAESAAMMEQYIFGALPADSPWMGGDLVDMTVVPDPTLYYETCQSGLNDYVGPLLGQGVCFASNWAKEIGFIFWIQLGFDVAVIFACIHEFFDVFKGLMYLATGVNFGKLTSTVVTNVVVPESGRGRR